MHRVRAGLGGARSRGGTEGRKRLCSNDSASSPRPRRPPTPRTIRAITTKERWSSSQAHTPEDAGTAGPVGRVPGEEGRGEGIARRGMNSNFQSPRSPLAQALEVLQVEVASSLLSFGSMKKSQKRISGVRRGKAGVDGWGRLCEHPALHSLHSVPQFTPHPVPIDR